MRVSAAPMTTTTLPAAPVSPQPLSPQPVIPAVAPPLLTGPAAPVAAAVPPAPSRLQKMPVSFTGRVPMLDSGKANDENAEVKAARRAGNATDLLAREAALRHEAEGTIIKLQSWPHFNALSWNTLKCQVHQLRVLVRAQPFEGYLPLRASQFRTWGQQQSKSKKVARQAWLQHVNNWLVERASLVTRLQQALEARVNGA